MINASLSLHLPQPELGSEDSWLFQQWDRKIQLELDWQCQALHRNSGTSSCRWGWRLWMSRTVPCTHHRLRIQPLKGPYHTLWLLLPFISIIKCFLYLFNCIQNGLGHCRNFRFDYNKTEHFATSVTSWCLNFSIYIQNCYFCMEGLIY